MKKSRFLAFLLAATLLFSAVSCGNSTPDPEKATKLSFKGAAQYNTLAALDGTTVKINGYLATSSPADGSFIFLMNLPYQSCPFCVPNTSQLSNTIEVYPPKGQKFYYTTQAVRVVGTLEVAPLGIYFTDPYGYQFSFKITNAVYTILKDDDLSADIALWQKIANSDCISELYKMYDYVNFLCAWPTYVVNTYTDAMGQVHKGYYLTASDAEYFLSNGAQFHYGRVDGYFEDLIAKIERVDATAFADLVQNVRDAKALADRALLELRNENYTYSWQYVERFDNSDYVYVLDKGDELAAAFTALYNAFADWLSNWEL